MVRARGLVKRFGDFAAVDGIDVEIQRGEAFGFLGPNGAGKSSTMRMIGCVSPATEGELHRPRSRPPARGRRDPGPARRRTAAGLPGHRADRARQPADLRALLRPAAGGGPGQGERAARLRPAGRPGGQHRRAALRRHEAPPDDRPGPGQPARAAAARRADHRARPAGAARALGPAVPAQAAGRHPRPDHALHGRGRAAVRPARRDGRRADRGRGQPALADRGVVDPRGARAAVRRRGPRAVRPAGRRPGRPGRGAARTGCCSTPTTARGSSRRCSAAACDRSPRWSAAAAWRTSSCGSPAGRWWTERCPSCGRASACVSTRCRPPPSARAGHRCGCCRTTCSPGGGCGPARSSRRSSRRCSSWSPWATAWAAWSVAAAGWSTACPTWRS